ncbi:MAG: hypothetical protein NTY57_07595 [Solirubrobacterales bacterium]|nr:hypothetical protein [Solirubrobacterales bacterium]
MSVKSQSAAKAEPQHLVALARANRVRLARAALKRNIASGETELAGVLLSNPWEVESMTVADLLSCQRRWGVTRCRRFLAKSRISETRTVGTLTQRQRIELADRLQTEPNLKSVSS